MIKPAMRLLGTLLILSATGCYIPMWRVPTPEPCQRAEDAWGDVVDCIGNLSPIDRPWHDPRYCKGAVYRVGPYGPPGPVVPEYEYGHERPYAPGHDREEVIPTPLPIEEDPELHLKPPY